MSLRKNKTGHIRILFTRKIQMFTVEWFFCPDGITPNSSLTGPNNTIYI